MENKMKNVELQFLEADDDEDNQFKDLINVKR